MKITAVVQKDERCIQIEFPCNDGYLTNQLEQIGVSDPLDNRQILKTIYDDVPTLLVLKEKCVDLDQLNYLAKRLDSFDKNELAQFSAAMTVKGFTDIKDMINLTFNLNNYTVITDFSKLEKIGKQHYLTVNGCISKDESEIDFGAVGRRLLYDEKGSVTPYGVLYDNGLPYEEMFDGRTFPEYYYEECAVCAAIAYNDRTEYLYLPCDNESIAKAAGRLGANSIEDCEVDHITPWNMSLEWLEKIDVAYDRADISNINDFLKTIPGFTDRDFDKLIAACAYAGVEGFPSCAVIAENLDSFEYIPGIKYNEDLGRYLIKESSEFQYDEGLDDFYNYEAFGVYTCEHQAGEINEYGYVGIKNDITLAEILGQDDMTMGGI